MTRSGKHGANVAAMLVEDTYCPITMTNDLFHGVWTYFDFFSDEEEDAVSWLRKTVQWDAVF